MAGELVVAGGQLVPHRAELRLADGLLALLDAHADSKGFLLHGKAGLRQHLKGVPGGVADGQHRRVCFQLVDTLRLGHGHAGQPRAVALERSEPVAEAHVAAQGDELLPHPAHHLPEHVRADVGLVRPADVLRRTVRHQRFQHGVDASVVGAGGQLAVGERPRAAFAELHIGRLIQLTGAPEALHVPGALLHRLSPLQHHRGHTGAGEV